MLKLIGVLIVIIGFVLKRDTIATVVVAGLATGLAAGLRPLEILDILGRAFITNRTATLFILTLPVIGICERYGLKDKAADFIRSLRRATVGRVLSVYLAVRSLAAAASIKLSGHPTFIRPIVEPMAEGAAMAKYGALSDEALDHIKGASSAMENYGNFFAQNVFMGSSGTLLIVTTMSEQGYAVDALQIALASIPIAAAAILFGTVQNMLSDKRLARIAPPPGISEREEGGTRS